MARDAPCAGRRQTRDIRRGRKLGIRDALDDAVAQRSLVGHSHVRLPGILTGWQNATLPSSVAFVVELPAVLDAAGG